MMANKMFFYFKRIWGIVLLIVTLFSCRKKDEEIPYVPVDFTITIANYSSLSAVNGWEYFSGGSKGIIVYRYSMDEFRAYDRNCSYKPTGDCVTVTVDTSGITATDACCNSQFQLIDGSVIKGPAVKPLLQYSTNYDAVRLRVYN